MQLPGISKLHNVYFLSIVVLMLISQLRSTIFVLSDMNYLLSEIEFNIKGNRCTSVKRPFMFKGQSCYQSIEVNAH